MTLKCEKIDNIKDAWFKIYITSQLTCKLSTVITKHLMCLTKVAETLSYILRGIR